MTIGLFGSCGDTTWRNRFMNYYDSEGISYYNPQVSDWKPEYADLEAYHLFNDEIILFPVTSETYGLGSLSEVGFSILNAIRKGKNSAIITMIDMHLDSNLMNEDLRTESMRARKLVSSHLSKLSIPTLYIVETIEEMLELSIKLYSELSAQKNRVGKLKC